MKEVSKFNIIGEEVNIKDRQARETANTALGTANTALNLANNINASLHGKYLFVADSYGLPEYGNWCNKTASILGLRKDIDYWDLTVSGSNIARGQWQEAISNWVSSHPSEVNNITHIILGGGINDSDAASVPYLPNALKALGNYITTTFGSDVKALLFFFGWALDDSIILSGRTANYRYVAQKYYSTASKYGFTYISGGELVLHNRYLIGPDGLHPTSGGGDAIAECVVNGIKCGRAMVSQYDNAVVVPQEKTVTGYVRQEVFDNNINVIFDNIQITGFNLLFENSAWVDVLPISLIYSNRLPETIVQLPVRDVANNTLTNLTFRMRVMNNRLQLALTSTSGGYFMSTRLKEININGNYTMNGMAD